ncbi:MAG: baseplate J/gp47 family protein [Zoogloea oleivorans]|jgi:hypothetical protein|uniref:baseplate J/gp47 family protein n=1 Tax=Zoogloea oleivorans TaxID=1552750 RepID=UPI002A363D3E|nr:baseplate J/gp47 family protein [Zoogloea oleivorans]MDY0037631.1 baseplate J/gp47 family protein [Zoogloea oleivorans]
MARQDILAALIAAAGTRQADRRNPHLDPAAAPLDGRDASGLLLAARALAGQLNDYGTDPIQPSGTWHDAFPQPAAGESDAAYRARLAALVDSDSGDMPPHLALLIASLKVARHPRALLNDFTRRHLDFQMQTVLGFTPQPARPDHAHLLVQLKKGATALEIGTDLRLSAGKDASQRELLYRPVRPAVINQARVVSLCAIRRAPDGHLYFAPIADSANGLGEKLPAEQLAWHPFGLRRPGQTALPDAPVGFAMAAAVLRLASGLRKISLSLGLDGIDPEMHSAATLAGAFEMHLSGAKGWIGPFTIASADSSVTANSWTFSVLVPADQPAIVDASPALLQQDFPAGLPIIRLQLREGAGQRFTPLSGLRVSQAKISVEASGIGNLTLEGDFGTLDPKKAFLPFGPQPAPGARFYVGSPEALGKRLTRLSLQLAWQGAPNTQTALTDLYAHYSGQGGLAYGVSAQAEWSDAGGSNPVGPVALLPAPGGRVDLNLIGNTGKRGYREHTAYGALARSGSAYARKQALYLKRRRGLASDAPSSPRAGFITLTLTTDLLHGAWRSEAIAGLLAKPPTPLKEPWTPKVSAISLAYTAEAGPTRLDEDSPASFTGAEIEFFHVDAFGVSREHLWLTGKRPWMPQGSVPLMPPHREAGELFIGLAGLAAGDPLSLLFQVADGSADPQAEAQTVSWSVLADNAWRALVPGSELTLDSTRSLRNSGIVSVVLPDETTTDNTRLPAGLVWLRAAVPAAPEAVCQLLGVHPNAVEVAFEDHANAASHLASALPAGSITRCLAPPASVKAISQPYASFGGALQEDASALARRAAERLRHRGRAITRRDFEHLVLQAFPAVDRVKCIPHASATSWLAPGHTMLVVVPDLRQRNAVDPLQPRVDLDTLEQIKAFILARTPMGLDASTLNVRNPAYRAVQVDFKVVMRQGFAFSYYRQNINQALLQALSPWAFDATRPLDFGGRVLRSALVDFVESLPWVDYVTDFRLSLAATPADDRPELAPDAPDAILVSAPQHLIAELT